MTAFKEFAIGKFVLRFYKTDHVWTCTVTEDMLDEVSKEIALQTLSDIGQAIEQKYCPLENNEAYEKGFIDGMAKQRDSRVQQVVEGYAQLRELTGDEIMEVCDEVGRDITKWGYFQIEFARAILKKASEK
jgi:hypothetical protein